MTEEKTTELKVVPKVPEKFIGWLETKLSKTVMMKLQSYIKTAKKNPINVNNTLAGNI